MNLRVGCAVCGRGKKPFGNMQIILVQPFQLFLRTCDGEVAGFGPLFCGSGAETGADLTMLAPKSPEPLSSLLVLINGDINFK